MTATGSTTGQHPPECRCQGRGWLGNGTDLAPLRWCTGPDGSPRVLPDRRKGPRRAEEAALHYAREALLAAGLAHAEDATAETAEALFDAATMYREAETRAG